MVIKTATVRAHVRMCNVPGKPGVGRRHAASGSKRQAAGAGGKSRGDWKGRAREGGGGDTDPRCWRYRRGSPAGREGGEQGIRLHFLHSKRTGTNGLMAQGTRLRFLHSKRMGGDGLRRTLIKPDSQYLPTRQLMQLVLPLTLEGRYHMNQYPELTEPPPQRLSPLSMPQEVLPVPPVRAGRMCELV